ncbi:MAG: SDR family NAD(P)-dependent oxidoreductase, partial [Coriobacteriia bacterium]|nr:SDR family NAD(P)-dependent oxidoreductase [Coriobacteriia bacterium]
MGNALSGKTIVITGSTRGIGRALAESVAAEGATVVVSSRTPEAVEGTVAAILQTGGSVSGLPCDVSSESDTQRLFDHALERWGRVDVWVNNAGISEGYRPFDELSPAEMTSIAQVNLVGTMLACRLLIPYFREHGGVLINMAGRGYRGEATPYTASYAATKAAVASLTKSLAAENKSAPISIHAFV